jgi:hypothetical protein
MKKVAKCAECAASDGTLTLDQTQGFTMSGSIRRKSAMNIGQLARQAGVPIDTVRYYERQQLLPTAARSAGVTASSASRTCAAALHPPRQDAGLQPGRNRRTAGAQ